MRRSSACARRHAPPTRDCARLVSTTGLRARTQSPCGPRWRQTRCGAGSLERGRAGSCRGRHARRGGGGSRRRAQQPAPLMAKPSALLQALLLLAAASAEAGEDAGGLLWVDAQPAQTWASGALSASNAAAAAGVRGSARRVSESDASEAATAEASRQRCSASSGCASCTAEGTCESCVNSDFALSSGQCVYCPVRWGFNAWEGNCYYPCREPRGRRFRPWRSARGANAGRRRAAHFRKKPRRKSLPPHVA